LKYIRKYETDVGYVKN